MIKGKTSNLNCLNYIQLRFQSLPNNIEFVPDPLSDRSLSKIIDLHVPSFLRYYPFIKKSFFLKKEINFKGTCLATFQDINDNQQIHVQEALITTISGIIYMV